MINLKNISRMARSARNPLLAALCLLFILSSSGCEGGRPPEESIDPETRAKRDLQGLMDDYRVELLDLEKKLKNGEVGQEAFDEFEKRTRLALEVFVGEHKGTETASNVIIGFATKDMEMGDFAAAEQRLDGIIADRKEGGSLALALLQKSILEADRDLESALALVDKAAEVKGIDQGTLFEIRLQRLKLLEWLKRDDEFDALYLRLIDQDPGQYIGSLALLRIQNFLRLGKLDAVGGLIDSVSGSVSEDMMLLLKGEVASQALVGRMAPSIRGTDISGVDFDLSSYKGNVVLVTFFTTSNPVILRRLPRLNRMYDEYYDSGLRLVGVCIDPGPDNLNPFVSAHDILWPVIYDGDMTMQKAYLVARDPKSYVIAPGGVVTSQGLEGVMLESHINNLLDNLY
jgi:peroxiredoxin